MDRMKGPFRPKVAAGDLEFAKKRAEFVIDEVFRNHEVRGFRGKPN